MAINYNDGSSVKAINFNRNYDVKVVKYEYTEGDENKSVVVWSKPITAVSNVLTNPDCGKIQFFYRLSGEETEPTKKTALNGENITTTNNVCYFGDTLHFRAYQKVNLDINNDYTIINSNNSYKFIVRKQSGFPVNFINNYNAIVRTEQCYFPNYNITDMLGGEVTKSIDLSLPEYKNLDFTKISFDLNNAYSKYGIKHWAYINVPAKASGYGEYTITVNGLNPSLLDSWPRVFAFVTSAKANAELALFPSYLGSYTLKTFTSHSTPYIYSCYCDCGQKYISPNSDYNKNSIVYYPPMNTSTLEYVCDFFIKCASATWSSDNTSVQFTVQAGFEHIYEPYYINDTYTCKVWIILYW